MKPAKTVRFPGVPCAPLPRLLGRNCLRDAAEVVPKEVSGILDLTLEMVIPLNTCNCVTVETNYVLPLCKSISARMST